jgi:hypothetical protein
MNQLNLGDWEIDTSTGTPILTYKKCSVLESEVADFLMQLICRRDLVNYYQKLVDLRRIESFVVDEEPVNGTYGVSIKPVAPINHIRVDSGTTPESDLNVPTLQEHEFGNPIHPDMVPVSRTTDITEPPPSTSAPIPPQEPMSNPYQDARLGYSSPSSPRIVCAANYYPEHGVLVIGIRHYDKIMLTQIGYWKARLAGYPEQLATLGEERQGFVDSRGNFLSRTQAWKVAVAEDQIIRSCGGEGADGGTLYSEHLY